MSDYLTRFQQRYFQHLKEVDDQMRSKMGDKAYEKLWKNVFESVNSCETHTPEQTPEECKTALCEFKNINFNSFEDLE